MKIISLDSMISLIETGGWVRSKKEKCTPKSVDLRSSFQTNFIWSAPIINWTNSSVTTSTSTSYTFTNTSSMTFKDSGSFTFGN